VLIILLICIAHTAFAEDFVVIVSSSNQVSTITKTALSNLFLKKVTKWGDGSEVVPADQAPSVSIRERFSQSVHSKSISSVKSYWQTQIFSGRASPPVELGSDAKVSDFVRNTPGAIGYVSAGYSGTGIKALKIEP
jgi:ABC-type phosphate transport system substrate-binding protein